MGYGTYVPQTGVVEIDVHGMTKKQAKAHIESAVMRAGASVYRIRVIHGYRGGTELRDMVRRELKNHPKVIRTELRLNPGETDLILRELY